MAHRYVGKTCPYCKTPILEEDAVVVCGTCDMPHHLGCWQDNKGCTTFGCTGVIQQSFGPVPWATPAAQPAPVQPTPVPAAPAQPVPMQPAPAPVQPAPVQASPVQAPPIRPAAPRLEMLSETCDQVIQKDAPVMLERVVLQRDSEKNAVFARCTFRSITDSKIRALLVDVACADVWGNSLEGVSGYQYLDLQAARDTSFGDNQAIPLPDSNTRSVQVTVHKVLLADGTMVECKQESICLPAPVTLQDHLGSAELAAEYARETTPMAKYAVCVHDGYWRCTCGALCTTAETACHQCGSEPERLMAVLNDPALENNMTVFLTAQAARQAQERAEQEARVREAETQVRADQEKMVREQRMAQRKAQKAQKRKGILIGLAASLVLMALAVCLVMFWVIPSMKYDAAVELLENEMYDSAYAEFIALGDFQDSADMAVETRYRQAGDFQERKNYPLAYKLYDELGTYKDSADKKKATAMLWCAQALGSQTSSVASGFKSSVKLTSSDYSWFYSTILLFIEGHTDATYWMDGWMGGAVPAYNVKIMLSMLPTTYEDTALLVKLFDVLSSSTTSYKTLFRNNSSLIQQCWSLSFVQDLAKQDNGITYFLEGYWTTWDGDYYLEFYESTDGGTTSSHNLPWVSKPRGTKYYDIENMLYYWDDANENHLAKVYRFTIVNYDTIQVYCYKNSRTYTLYRR